jgi:DNA helicase-2/ATP-dependent DNA helicase PcrA
MMDYSSYLKERKALLVAPAGYGKTYTLAESVKYADDRSLVLTHTHAGVSSINTKLKDLFVEPSGCSVETISSFAQRYVTSFYTGNDIPPQEDGNNYHPFVIEKATLLFSNPLIKKVISSTYSGLFVDEYQDCTTSQHKMLMVLSESLRIRVLGDPLQGIFGFNEPLVDFDSDFDEFTSFPPLSTPHRWRNSGRADLGEDLQSIRELLENNDDIEICEYRSIESVIGKERDKFDPRTEYSKVLRSLQDEESLLFIHPESRNKAPRLKMAKIFKRMTSIESIDDKDFYNTAKLADSVIEKGDILKALKDVSYNLLNKSGLDQWFNAKGFKNKKDLKDKKKVDDILLLISNFSKLHDFCYLLEKVTELRGVSKPRPEMYRGIISSIEIAEEKSTSIYSGMIEQRNRVRRSGRRINGRHIGTTLLTKGLEFDVVVVLDAQKFTSPRHLYVALTRCCKRLIVISDTKTLSPRP